MKIDGQCHCGRVRYTATVDPENASVCHCTDCQAISGSAFRTTLRVPDSDFEMTGDTKTYMKIAASGNERVLVFCPNCGTQMYGTMAGDGPKLLSVRLGTANQRAQLPPKRQIWCQSAMPWLNNLATVPMSQEQD
ncbi:MAG: GFA family protein [Alphaproteobacteria bacterium]|nr:GFA family protein [Alphaproteobacteria bacterium]